MKNSDVSHLQGIPKHVALTAVELFVDFQASENKHEFELRIERWRQEHQDHDRAWRHIEYVNNQFANVAVGDKSVAHKALISKGPISRRNALKMLTVLFSTGTSAWLIKEQIPWQAWVADKRTQVGGQDQFILAGHKVEMNTNTSVNIFKNDEGALVKLIEGEILISAPSNDKTQLKTTLLKTGQIKVDVSFCKLISRDAQFSVLRQGDVCRLIVLAGAVDIMGMKSSRNNIQVIAGDQVNIDLRTVGKAKPANKQALAWQKGMLVATSMRLEDFLIEVSRYRLGTIRCSKGIANLKVSGTYPINNTDQILAALESSLPIKMQYLTRYFVTAQSAAV